MGSPDGKHKPFHWRGLTSLTLTLVFMVLVVSGVILYISPKGRVANWTGWTVWGLGKEQWGAVHTLAALAVVIAAAFHLYFNWATFLSYFKTKLRAGFNLKREFALACVMTVGLVAGTVWSVPPFGTVIRWGDAIKDYWERESASAPAPHAEEFTLGELAAQVGLPEEEVTEKLGAVGYEWDDPSMTLGALAEQYGKTPDDLFSALGEKAPGSGSRGNGNGRGTGQGARGNGNAGDAGHGRGLGRLTIEQVCADEAIPLERALEALSQDGMEMDGSDTLRDVAERLGVRPSEVLERITGHK